MKTIKVFCTAIVLSLTISISAFAGEIATPGAACPGKTSISTFSTDPSALPADTKIDDVDSSAFCYVLLTLLSMF